MTRFLKPIMYIIIFAITAVAVLVLVRAVSSSIAVDSSSIVSVTNTTTVPDNTANGNSYLRFDQEPISNIKSQGIILIGDSLMHQPYENGDQSYPGHRFIIGLADTGWQDITIDAHGCRANNNVSSWCGSTQNFQSILAQVSSSSYTSGSNVSVNNSTVRNRLGSDSSYFNKVSAKNINTAFRQSGTIVVGLGTNDNFDNNNYQSGITNTINSLRQLNPNIDIYWVRMCAKQNQAGNGAAFNAVLDQKATQMNFKKIDWASQCQDNYITDGTHYNETGSQAYINTIVNAIN